MLQSVRVYNFGRKKKKARPRRRWLRLHGILLGRLQHSNLELGPQGGRQWRRHSVANLPVLVLERSLEPEVVRKALRPGILPHRRDAVLHGVQAPPRLAHGLRVGHHRLEVVVPVEAAEEALPVVMPLRSVREAPGDEL